MTFQIKKKGRPKAESYKVRSIKGITPKGYDGDYKIEKDENGEYIVKFYKKKKNE